ncbi:MAG: glutamate-1-semialdehyde 2,1-aminomutase [Dictyoglomaceae bacterium]
MDRKGYGVNSPVRSFKAVGGYPIFVKKGKGSKIYDEKDRSFIDYCLSFGALILGHAHKEVVENLKKVINKGTSFGINTKLEIEFAKMIVEGVPSIEQVRLTNSGTEAVMSAVRLARAYTKKDKIIKFDGAYHGHADYLLVKAGSGSATLGIPASLGVPGDFIKHTILLPFNDIKSLNDTLKKYYKEVACVIVEPVLGNCGVIPPEEEFLGSLREITYKYEVLLIFDEVITGFRLSYGGAQEYFHINPDLTCLGKILGGGLPVGAFGGKKEIMKLLAPEGNVYQAGTFSGNPLTVMGGIATLNILKRDNPYKALEERTRNLCEEIKNIAQKYSIDIQVNYIGSMFSIFFTSKKVRDYETAKIQDTVLFNKFFHNLLEEGIYISPSGFESNFLSIAHNNSDLEKTLRVIHKVLRRIRR